MESVKVKRDFLPKSILCGDQQWLSASASGGRLGAAVFELMNSIQTAVGAYLNGAVGQLILAGFKLDDLEIRNPLDVKPGNLRYVIAGCGVDLYEVRVDFDGLRRFVVRGAPITPKSDEIGGVGNG